MNNAQTLRNKLIRKAYENPTLRNKLLPVIQKMAKQQPMPSINLAIALRLAQELRGGKEAATKLPTVVLEAMPGLSAMQTRQQIDRIVEVRQELQMLADQYDAVLKRLKGLEDEEKEGIKKLQTAAKNLREKANYCVETEKAILSFQAWLQDAAPGIAQIIMTPEEAKAGEKAGDFFGRVAVKCGDAISKQVQIIWDNCKEDLVVATPMVKQLKILEKTSSISAVTLKTAGLADFLVDFKEWLSGKARSFLQTVGDIGRWLKGFITRTKLVDEAQKTLADVLEQNMKVVDTFIKKAA